MDHILPEEELIEYTKPYLKAKGFKKKNKRWTKSIEDFTLCFYIQGSCFSKENYYIRPGIFVNSLLPTELVYGHWMTQIEQTTPEKVLRDFEEWCEQWTNKSLIKERLLIDGVGNWVFTNRYGTVLSPKNVNSAIERIIRDYNREEEALAKEAGRTPQLLPHITNHQLRHSFCTRLMEESCKPGSNIPLKLIQDIMGHADFSTTMDIYTDVSEKFKQDSMQAIQGSIYLG